jgi:hypothetical protein
MTTPTIQFELRAEQTKTIQRVLDIAGITDPTIRKFITRQFVNGCSMAFYDGVLAQIGNTQTLIAISPRQKGKKS